MRTAIRPRRQRGLGTGPIIALIGAVVLLVLGAAFFLRSSFETAPAVDKEAERERARKERLAFQLKDNDERFEQIMSRAQKRFEEGSFSEAPQRLLEARKIEPISGSKLLLELRLFDARVLAAGDDDDAVRALMLEAVRPLQPEELTEKLPADLREEHDPRVVERMSASTQRFAREGSKPSSATTTMERQLPRRTRANA